MLSDTTKLNRAFKATVGVAHTEDQRFFFQELFPYLAELVGVDIKTDLVPLTPTLTDDTDISGVVELLRRPLTPVPTTSNKVWAVCPLVNEPVPPRTSWRYDLPGVWSPATRRMHFIHPRYDTPINGGSNNLVTSRYVAKLYRHDAASPPYYEGAQIPPTATPDGSPSTGGWEFEYESGLLYFTASPTAFGPADATRPLHLRVFQYIGTFGNFGGAGTVQKVFSNPYAFILPLAVGDAVFVDPAATDSVLRADSGSGATADAIGIVTQLNFPLPGQCVVQVAGEVTGVTLVGTAPFWGKRIYLGPLGTLVDTAPTVGAVKQLGIARSNNAMAMALDAMTVL